MYSEIYIIYRFFKFYTIFFHKICLLLKCRFDSYVKPASSETIITYFVAGISVNMHN